MRGFWRYLSVIVCVVGLAMSVTAQETPETMNSEDAGLFDWVEQLPSGDVVAPNFTCAAIPFPVANETDLTSAINNAMNDTTCPGADVIELGGNDIVLTSQLPTFDSNITIQNGTIQRSGSAGSFRLLRYRDLNGNLLTLKNLVLANGSEPFGAAIYVTSGTVSIEESVIRNNSSQYGAVRAFGANSRLAISNSSLYLNTASVDGGVLGLGSGATAYVVNSTFESNSASSKGGAIEIPAGTSLMMINVALRGNQSFDGGAIYSAGNIDLINVLMNGNLADNFGGGLYVEDDSGVSTDAELLNVTISGNRAVDVSGGGGIRMESGDADVDNTIVWGNLSGSAGGFTSDNTTINISSATIGFSYSILEGGTPSGATNDNTNYYTDPLFVTPVTPTTVNLPNEEGNYRIGDSTSPAIDTGLNFDVAGGRSINSIEHDLDGKTRIQNSFVDIGAYESSPFLGTSADVNADGIVSPVDAVYVRNRIGTSDLSADVNNDGVVNNADVQDVLNALP